MAGRARDQRHHGRRGPAAARVPRPADDEETAAAARWIRSQQRADGTWANFYGGAGDLSTTVEAYVALRLAGDEPDAPHMKQAAPGSWTRAASRRPACSPGSGWRFRPVVLGRPAGHPARADLPAGLVPAQHLRLGLLGPADHRGRWPWSSRSARPAHWRSSIDELRPAARTAAPPARAAPPTPAPSPARPPRRRTTSPARHLCRSWATSSTPSTGPAPLPTGQVGKAGGAAPLRGVDHRPAGAGRLLGRHPAALGVLADGAEPARLPNRASDHAARPRRS